LLKKNRRKVLTTDVRPIQVISFAVEDIAKIFFSAMARLSDIAGHGKTSPLPPVSKGLPQRGLMGRSPSQLRDCVVLTLQCMNRPTVCKLTITDLTACIFIAF